MVPVRMDFYKIIGFFRYHRTTTNIIAAEEFDGIIG